jgi:hypothetical protein
MQMNKCKDVYSTLKGNRAISCHKSSDLNVQLKLKNRNELAFQQFFNNKPINYYTKQQTPP